MGEIYAAGLDSCFSQREAGQVQSGQTANCTKFPMVQHTAVIFPA